jgi:tetratricopeptide (TPR) repeat protein
VIGEERTAPSSGRSGAIRGQRRLWWLLVAALLVALVAALPAFARAARRNVDSLHAMHALFDDDPSTRLETQDPYFAGVEAYLDGDLADAETLFAAVAPINQQPACRYRLLGHAQQDDWSAAAALAPSCTNPLHFDLFLQQMTQPWQPPSLAASAAVETVLAHASNAGVANAAAQLYGEGAYEEAERWSRLVLAQGPNDAAALVLGLSLFQQSRYADAAPEFERYTVAQPLEPMGWYWLGRSQIALGQYDAAVEVLRQAIEVSEAGDSRRVYFFGMLASALGRSGACSEATESMAQADKLADDGSRATLVQIQTTLTSLCPR